MESDKHSPSVENDETKTSFRKPTNDGANRKYRRHTPVSGSSSSDESHKRNDISSPKHSEEDKKVSEKQGRKDMTRDDRRSNQGEHVRNSESSRYSRSSQDYSRHDDYKSRNRVPDEDRNYSKLSSRSHHSDHRDRRSEFSKSRDHYRDSDRYSRDRAGSDRRHDRHDGDESAHDDRDRYAKDRDYRGEKRDFQRSSRDTKGYEESRGHRDDTNSKGESSKHLLKEAYKNDPKTEDDKRPNEERRKYDEKYLNKRKDAVNKDSEERLKDVDAYVIEHNESTTKRQKYNDWDSADPKTNGSKQSQEVVVKSVPGQANASESAGDVDTAKDAAMKAAALVNQNLYGAGTMTADQKKKLLWGNKKKNTVEETSQRWTTAIFPDQERQEKFNKLMGVKGEYKVEQKATSDPVQAEKVQMDLEKQYTAGLRRRDGRTVGLGL